ncbi:MULTISPECIES: SDR family NAD(P)-dependent oxidoreductase [Spongiibacter]|uniref:SDR family NAD(P)-dependent oxidoreductase n=3 Tax=Spongiibacteraceae TaxID=1706375 RepID=UPI000C6B0F14|nr:MULTISPECIES: SDR family NAD(P)-dependent oxidoreductase [Spongiibacter]MBU73070.1 acetoin dehydrogenase [Spongiibacter sp.]|tara:strand:- start:22209 stop:23018 length:810 start_codon:yes stop_codon:yes gene_type:complete
MSQEQRVYAITGAASGIGLALVKQLLEVGQCVAASDISAEALADMRALAPEAQLMLSPLDVADREAFNAWADAVVEHFAGVDVIVNNAGVSLSCHAGEQPREHFEWLFNINFWGVVNGCEAFLPHLSARSGTIVNISSLFGLMSVPSQSAYNSAKFAVRGYSESLRQDLRGSGVSVLTVHPGGIKTNIARNGRHFHDLQGNARGLDATAASFDRVARTSPESAAAAILRALRKGRRRLLIGGDARLLDVIQRMFPGRYDQLLGPLLRFG